MDLLAGESQGRWEARQRRAPRAGTVQEDVSVQHTLVLGVLGGGGVNSGQFGQLRVTGTLHFKPAHIFCYSLSIHLVFVRWNRNQIQRNISPATVEINPRRSSGGNPSLESTSTSPA